MFYALEKNDHGLSHDPFKSCVVPRPIAWISTVSEDGICNLAPYSQFQNLSFDPPYVMFSANQTSLGRPKDTVVNVERTGEFVHNMVTYDLREAMNRSAQQVPSDVDEFELAGVTKAPSKLLKVPRVAESPVHFECRYVRYEILENCRDWLLRCTATHYGESNREERIWISTFMLNELSAPTPFMN